MLSGSGHTTDVWVLQPEAVRHLLTTFYETGEVDDSLFTYQPMDFSVGFLSSFPNLAKLVVVVPLLVIILLVALVWFIVRRRKANQVSS